MRPAHQAPLPALRRTVHIRIDPGEFERVAVIDDVVQEAIMDGGDFVNAEYVDGVYCQVCDTAAALDMWNGTRRQSDLAALRDFDAETQEGVAANG